MAGNCPNLSAGNAWLRGAAAWLVLIALLAPLLAGWLSPSADQPLEGAITHSSLGPTVAVAAMAATIGTTLGLWFAAAITLGGLPARGLWATLLIIPFASPPTVWTLTQSACFGRGGLLENLLGDGWRAWLAAADAHQYLATTLVLAQVASPLAMLIIARGLERLRFGGWDAARLQLSGRRQAAWLLRAIRRELSAAWLLAFALSLTNFAVPHVMQCRLYIVEVYLRSANYLDQFGALRTALPLVALALAAAGGFAWLDRGQRYASTAAEPAMTSRRNPLVIALLALYIAVAILLPLAALVRDCRSIEHFVQAVREAGPETINTLQIAGGAALTTCLAAGMIAPWSARGRRIAPELLAMLPLGLPPLVIGLAYARTFRQPWTSAIGLLADTSLLVVLALSCRALPFAFRILSEAARRQPPEWDEAARLSGMSAARRWGWIAAPIWLRPAATAALIALLLSAGDVEVSHLLTVPGSGTLAMRLFTFLHFGPAHVTASLALWQLIVVLAPLALYYLLTDRFPHVV